MGSWPAPPADCYRPEVPDAASPQLAPPAAASPTVTAAPRHHASPAATKYSKPVQRKLVVGASNDPLEREADRIASLVVDGGDGGAEVGTPFATAPLVSRISRSSVIGSEGGAVDAPTERDISAARSGG